MKGSSANSQPARSRPEGGRERRTAFLSLLLLVPAPSIGVAYAMFFFPNSDAGAAVFAACKLWVCVLPAAWRIFIEKLAPSLSPARKGGFGAGALSGFILAAVILAAYALNPGGLADKRLIAEKLAGLGLAEPARYAAAAAYWVLVNSALEEYVWRWFCVRQSAALLPPGAAVVCAAACFTAHHALALSAYLSAAAAALCSAGVFLGALLWSAMYLRYRSIWPGYISHAIVDIAVFGAGAFMLFG